MVTDISKGRDSTVPVFVGLSTDTKPTDVDNGSEFREFDTGKLYYFDAENVEWYEQPGGGGGGGGGDSDFSTAQVTFVNNTGGNVSVSAPIILDEEEISALLPTYSFSSPDDTTQIGLYKGNAVLLIPGTYVITYTGDITEIVANIQYLVTGDCTITISIA
jgi:hypothetical protein